MANQQLSGILKSLRRTKGYTQQQAADLLGLKNKSTLGSWEIGKSEPDIDTLLRLCRIYEVADIYAAFGETSPSCSVDDKPAVFHEYLMLQEKYRKLVDAQVKQLLQLQEKGG